MFDKKRPRRNSKKKKKMQQEKKEWRKENQTPIDSSSWKNLYNAIASTANNPPSVLAPDDGTDTLSSHKPVAGDLLCTAPFLKGPKS